MYPERIINGIAAIYVMPTIVGFHLSGATNEQIRELFTDLDEEEILHIIKEYKKNHYEPANPKQPAH